MTNPKRDPIGVAGDITDIALDDSATSAKGTGEGPDLAACPSTRMTSGRSVTNGSVELYQLLCRLAARNGRYACARGERVAAMARRSLSWVRKHTAELVQEDWLYTQTDGRKTWYFPLVPAPAEEPLPAPPRPVLVPSAPPVLRPARPSNPAKPSKLDGPAGPGQQRGEVGGSDRQELQSARPATDEKSLKRRGTTDLTVSAADAARARQNTDKVSVTLTLPEQLLSTSDTVPVHALPLVEERNSIEKTWKEKRNNLHTPASIDSPQRETVLDAGHMGPTRGRSTDDIGSGVDVVSIKHDMPDGRSAPSVPPITPEENASALENGQPVWYEQDQEALVPLIVAAAVEAGFPEKRARYLVKEYGSRRVRDCLRYAIHKGADSVPGLVTAALYKGWDLWTASGGSSQLDYASDLDLIAEALEEAIGYMHDEIQSGEEVLTAAITEADQFLDTRDPDDYAQVFGLMQAYFMRYPYERLIEGRSGDGRPRYFTITGERFKMIANMVESRIWDIWLANRTPGSQDLPSATWDQIDTFLTEAFNEVAVRHGIDRWKSSRPE